DGLAGAATAVLGWTCHGSFSSRVRGGAVAAVPARLLVLPEMKPQRGRGNKILVVIAPHAGRASRGRRNVGRAGACRRAQRPRPRPPSPRGGRTGGRGARNPSRTDLGRGGTPRTGRVR